MLGKVDKSHLHARPVYQSRNFSMIFRRSTTVLAVRIPRWGKKSKISFLRSSYVQYLSLDMLGNVGKWHLHSSMGKPAGTQSTIVLYISLNGFGQNRSAAPKY